MRVLFSLLVIVVLLGAIYPVFWIFLTSFKQLEDLRAGSPISFPRRLDFTNYRNAVINSRIGLYFKNSLLLTSISIVGIVSLMFAKTVLMSNWKSSFPTTGYSDPFDTNFQK
jgi:ABC-type glycerol-3-phosphate transport system permease component